MSKALHAVAVLCASTWAASARPAFAQEPAAARPRLPVGALPADLRLDGVLDEPAWAAAPTSSDLTMVEPQEGGHPAGRTTVKGLASARALAFGLRCDDPEPDGIVSFTKERDGDFDAEDHVIVVLDPFQDGRSGYVFAVNPGGARRDALVDPGGDDVNTNWDGAWEAATRRDSAGWTVEIRIPIETLRFRRDLTEWSFNVQRRVQRLQETSRWASPRRDYSVFQTSRAGLLTGLPRFDLGLGLGVRPSFVGGFQRSRSAAAMGVFEPSLDVTQRVGSNLLASLTVNTDFAETEVDTRQTNLTRFPLFFPEKRTFFLEGADIFAFGAGLDGDSLVPFFSRRIGLAEERTLPILGGLKLTGRMGATNVGGLVVSTREEAGLALASAMGAVRLKQDVFAESRAGVLLAAGDPLGRGGSWEAGADFTYQTSSFRGDKNFSAGVWALATGRDDLEAPSGRSAFGLQLAYPNDLWNCSLAYRRVGVGFDPSLGFVPRRGIAAYKSRCTYAPRPEGTFIRQMFHELHSDLVTDLASRWESYRVFTAPINWQLESGDRVEANVVPTGERLVEPFEIAAGVTLPPGAFHWRRYRLEVETAAKRRLAGQATWWFGGFFTGTLHQLELEAAWTPSPIVTLLLNAERDIGRLPEGEFDLTLVGAKVRLNVSSDLQLDCFLQYDTEEKSLGTNSRLRYSFRPWGSLFVIYNHNLREIQDRWRRDANQLLVKLQYTLRR